MKREAAHLPLRHLRAGALVLGFALVLVVLAARAWGGRESIAVIDTPDVCADVPESSRAACLELKRAAVLR